MPQNRLSARRPDQVVSVDHRENRVAYVQFGRVPIPSVFRLVTVADQSPYLAKHWKKIGSELDFLVLIASGKTELHGVERLHL